MYLIIYKIYKEFIQLNSKKKKKTQIIRFLNGQKALLDISPKKMFRLSIGIWKGFQHSLGIGKMQIKTKIRYDLIFVRLSVVEKTRKNMCFWECGRKGNLCTVGGNLSWCKKIKWTIVWRFLKKLKKELPYNSAIPILVV